MSLIQYTTEEQINQMREELKNARLAMESPEYRRKNLQKKVIKRTGSVLFAVVALLLLAVLFSVIAAKSHGKTVSFFNYSLYRIESGSMEPTLMTGNVIVVKKCDNPQNLKKDDIVTFLTKDGVTVTHRIVEVITEPDGSVFYRTKGDNPKNSADAELLSPDRVIAVLKFKIPLT